MTTQNGAIRFFAFFSFFMLRFCFLEFPNGDFSKIQHPPCIKVCTFPHRYQRYESTVNCFEVSSTGFISKRNKSTLTTLHKLMKQDMKKSTFLSNFNSLAWYGSYKIWLTREDPTFAEPPFLVPHIN